MSSLMFDAMFGDEVFICLYIRLFIFILPKATVGFL